jgi:hypothetical protein
MRQLNELTSDQLPNVGKAVKMFDRRMANFFKLAGSLNILQLTTSLIQLNQDKSKAEQQKSVKDLLGLSFAIFTY